MMANFMQAIKWMKEGKKVRREPQWHDVYYALKDDNEIIKQNFHDDILLDLRDIEATDWEIYEEEWNLADEKYIESNDRKFKTIEDIKTFIQKVKEDIDKENLLRWKKPGGLLDDKKFNEIIDKRAGKL